MIAGSIHTCIVCNGVISFRSPNNNLVVCPFCQTRLYKTEYNELKARIDISRATIMYGIIQVGTKGKYAGNSFEITGGIKYLFDETLLNCWTMLFANGGTKILAELLGTYAVLEKIDLAPGINFSKLKQLGFDGKTITLSDDKSYALERISYCKDAEAVGETWIFSTDTNITLFELATLERERLFAFRIKEDLGVYFKAAYKEKDDFNFQNPRQPKWEDYYKEVNCPKCSFRIQLKSYPLTKSFSCGKCGARVSYEQGKPEKEVSGSKSGYIEIPLGSKGFIRDAEYEVIGYAKKRDKDGYSWKEYTLFNPEFGYSFLSEYEGNWIFLSEQPNAPVLYTSSQGELVIDGESFALFNKYDYKLLETAGEFPENIFDDRGVAVNEYISPPEIWIREKENANGVAWFKGVHIEGKELENAFGSDKVVLPAKYGIGAVQPVWGYVNPSLLFTAVLVTLAVFLGAQIIMNNLSAKNVVYESNIILPDSTNIPPIVSPTFELKKWKSNLEISLHAPVNNSWFEANITVVNTVTGKEYTIEKRVEYYTGYDSDGYWSEGSNKDEVIISSIPAGKYYLQIFPAKQLNSNIDYFYITVTSDVPMWRNFFIITLLMLLIPAGWWYYMRTVEVRRWSNSPFSTYVNWSSDDE
ncbi:MAG TPA: DUF4178 domain-containing protein [Chitinophagaceae bacterium]|nr:DUF4178 domain-containing protein [Chitinophagaceae bacterium]